MKSRSSPLKPGSSLKQMAIAERRMKAWYLRQEGYTEARIAAQLGASQKTITDDLQIVISRLTRKMDAMAERIKLEQTYQLQHVLSEALAAWEESKKPTKRNTTKQYQQPVNPMYATTTQAAVQMQLTSAIHTISTNERTGNVEYLNMALQAMEQLRKLWGIGMVDGEVNNYVLPMIREVRMQPPTNPTPTLPDGNIIDVIPSDDGNEED